MAVFLLPSMGWFCNCSCTIYICVTLCYSVLGQNFCCQSNKSCDNLTECMARSVLPAAFLHCRTCARPLFSRETKFLWNFDQFSTFQPYLGKWIWRNEKFYTKEVLFEQFFTDLERVQRFWLVFFIEWFYFSVERNRFVLEDVQIDFKNAKVA